MTTGNCLLIRICYIVVCHNNYSLYQLFIVQLKFHTVCCDIGPVYYESMSVKHCVIIRILLSDLHVVTVLCVVLSCEVLLV